MRCKVGDLAWLSNSVMRPEWVGMIVDVLEHAPAGCFSKAPDGVLFGPPNFESWICETRGSPFSHRSGVSRFAVIADKCLRPIRPDADPEAITTDETLKVSA